jgi:uncharacterized protein
MSHFYLRNIVKEIKLCTTLLSKARGLMFTKKKDKALVFIYNKEELISLHMFFVFYPIDVLFLNREKEVIEIKENFRPSTGYMPKNRARYVIELPEKKIQQYKIKLHDKIEF